MDCLEGMKRIPDKSIDLIVTDPPYNIGKAKWDKINNYIEWMGTIFKEWERILKDNGSFYFFHNDMPQIAQLMEWLRLNTKFVFNSFIIWDKGDFRALGWKNPSKNNNLRSWFNTCEYCLYYTFQDETGLEQIQPLCFKPYLDYMTSERNKAGLTIKQCNDLTGHISIASHWFWQPEGAQPQPRFIQKVDYEKLQSTGYFQKEYESLRYTHNLDTNHNNVWRSQERNKGKQHPAQKPTDIIERIIKTSSNEKATVLDCFMGSGTTAIACINTNRNYIGFEIDPDYYEVAQERIRIHMQQQTIFELL